MITINVVAGGYTIAIGGTVYRTVHKAMTAAEAAWERYGKQVEWVRDPASQEYIGFPYTAKIVMAK